MTSFAGHPQVMLTEIYIEALLVDEELADQVWEAWDAYLQSCSTHSHQIVRRSDPALCPDCGLLIAVPLRQHPSLHHLRRGRALFVRRLRRYYDTVRLLIHVLVHR